MLMADGKPVKSLPWLCKSVRHTFRTAAFRVRMWSDQARQKLGQEAKAMLENAGKERQLTPEKDDLQGCRF